MKHPNIDKLLNKLAYIKIDYARIEINDHRYICGRYIPNYNTIFLNERNLPRTNIDTISHELMHWWYDVKQGYNLQEKEIEELSQRHLAMIPEYHDTIERRLNNDNTSKTA